MQSIPLQANIFCLLRGKPNRKMYYESPFGCRKEVRSRLKHCFTGGRIAKAMLQFQLLFQKLGGYVQ